MAAWTPGTPLGLYVLLAPIGAGGMGEVWKARDTRLDRIVAVKRLKGQHSARFEQEARAIAALNHPHICQIHDIGPDYLVLEYIEGAPLHGPLPAEECVRAPETPDGQRSCSGNFGRAMSIGLRSDFSRSTWLAGSRSKPRSGWRR
jgi:serine/threonine protein kinase